MKKSILGVLVSLLLGTTATATEQRWFEVEMIIFSRTPAQQQLEQFDHLVRPIKLGRSTDLLTPLYQQDIRKLLAALPDCEPDTDHLVIPGSDYRFSPLSMRTLCISEYYSAAWQQKNLFIDRPYNTVAPFPARLPSTITGKGEHRSVPYLTDTASLQLTAEARKIQQQRGYSILLHTAWRQAPVTERLAIPSRWYAGNNYSDDFDYWGLPKKDTAPATDNYRPVADTESPEADLLTDIDTLLSQLKAGGQLPPPAENKEQQPVQTTSGNLPEQVWQLDGLFRLHLDHYLFVNTEFNLRRLNNQHQLESLYTRQSRRVISGEIHYLDHPYLGIVLQIRRYDPVQEAANE
ncbi:CsiV family protein [Chromatiaceae bacterium AAb-1]|nr:CsiV family protein [Chromatiaceae bacterium AAb-1]